MSRHRSNEVGYGKPPRRTQFRKGRSGNPKGRPKGTLNFKKDLDEELGKTVQIREGSAKTVSKQRAVVMAWVAKAANGDARALNLLVKAMEAYQEPEPEPEELSLDEEEILATYRKQAIEANRQSQPSPPTESDTSKGEPDNER